MYDPFETEVNSISSYSLVWMACIIVPVLDNYLTNLILVFFPRLAFDAAASIRPSLESTKGCLHLYQRYW